MRCERLWDDVDDEDLDDHSDIESVARARYEDDYSRILHSSAFRRLEDVTQVVAASEGPQVHNRLTHSLKVSQAGEGICSGIRRRAAEHSRSRELVRQFGGLNELVVRAACLAHDLGHPPFGHIGEQSLQQAVEEFRPRLPGGEAFSPLTLDDGFEGNAQSFRIVTRLAHRESKSDGGPPVLNLTRATLSAIAKYPWGRSDPRNVSEKWNAYDDDLPTLRWAMADVAEREVNFFGRPRSESRTIEAQVMDWADDIAYAVHDVEDFYRAGLIPLDALADQGGEFRRFERYAIGRVMPKVGHFADKFKLRDVLERLSLAFPADPYIGSVANRGALHVFASSVITRASTNLTIGENGILLPDSESVIEIELLKQLTWCYVIDRVQLSSAQRGQQLLLERLLRRLWVWASARFDEAANLEWTPDQLSVEQLEDDEIEEAQLSATNRWLYSNLPPRLVDFADALSFPNANVRVPDLGPPEARSSLGEGHALKLAQLRATIDYLSSLSERQVFDLNERLTGTRGTPMLDSNAIV